MCTLPRATTGRDERCKTGALNHFATSPVWLHEHLMIRYGSGTNDSVDEAIIEFKTCMTYAPVYAHLTFLTFSLYLPSCRLLIPWSYTPLTV